MLSLINMHNISISICTSLGIVVRSILCLKVGIVSEVGVKSEHEVQSLNRVLVSWNIKKST